MNVSLDGPPARRRWPNSTYVRSLQKVRVEPVRARGGLRPGSLAVGRRDILDGEGRTRT